MSEWKRAREQQRRMKGKKFISIWKRGKTLKSHWRWKGLQPHVTKSKARFFPLTILLLVLIILFLLFFILTLTHSFTLILTLYLRISLYLYMYVRYAEQKESRGENEWEWESTNIRNPRANIYELLISSFTWRRENLFMTIKRSTLRVAVLHG